MVTELDLEVQCCCAAGGCRVKGCCAPAGFAYWVGFAGPVGRCPSDSCHQGSCVSPDKGFCVWLGGVLRSHLKELCFFTWKNSILYEISRKPGSLACPPIDTHFPLLICNPIMGVTWKWDYSNLTETTHNVAVSLWDDWFPFPLSCFLLVHPLLEGSGTQDWDLGRRGRWPADLWFVLWKFVRDKLLKS